MGIFYKFELFFNRFVAKWIASLMAMLIVLINYMDSWPSGLGDEIRIVALWVRSLIGALFDGDFDHNSFVTKVNMFKFKKYTCFYSKKVDINVLF